MQKLIKAISKFFSGLITIGPITIYGRNAMRWGVTIRSRKYGYICFRLPFRCFGRWWPLYFYCSPNATPWAATFMLGHGFDDNWALSRIRRKVLGHGFDMDAYVDDYGVTYRSLLYAINNNVGLHKSSYLKEAMAHHQA